MRGKEKKEGRKDGRKEGRNKKSLGKKERRRKGKKKSSCYFPIPSPSSFVTPFPLLYLYFSPSLPLHLSGSLLPVLPPHRHQQLCLHVIDLTEEDKRLECSD